MNQVVIQHLAFTNHSHLHESYWMEEKGSSFLNGRAYVLFDPERCVQCIPLYTHMKGDISTYMYVIKDIGCHNK